MAPEKIFRSTSTEAMRDRAGLAVDSDPEYEVKCWAPPGLHDAGDDGQNQQPPVVGYADDFRQKWQKT